MRPSDGAGPLLLRRTLPNGLQAAEFAGRGRGALRRRRVHGCLKPPQWLKGFERDGRERASRGSRVPQEIVHIPDARDEARSLFERAIGGERQRESLDRWERASGERRGVHSGRRARAQPNMEAPTFRAHGAGPRALRDWLWEAGATHTLGWRARASPAPGLRRPRGAFRADRRQCPAHARRAGAQDRYGKDSEWTADLVRWSDRQELRTAATAAGSFARAARATAASWWRARRPNASC